MQGALHSTPLHVPTLNLYPHSLLLLSEWNRNWSLFGALNVTVDGHFSVPTFWS